MAIIFIVILGSVLPKNPDKYLKDRFWAYKVHHKKSYRELLIIYIIYFLKDRGSLFKSFKKYATNIQSFFYTTVMIWELFFIKYLLLYIFTCLSAIYNNN